jgi:hypothetical protein
MINDPQARRRADQFQAATHPSWIADDNGLTEVAEFRPGASHNLRPNAGDVAQCD